MAGGPISPISIGLGTSGRGYPGIYVGATNARRFQPHLIVEASLSTNTVTVDLIFQFPKTLPSGTCKLHILMMANATTGAAYGQISWASAAIGDTPDTITLNSEGAAAALYTWTAGDDDELIEYELTLDADTPVAGEYCVMRVVFGNSASHNLAQVMAAFFEIVWE